MRCAAVRIALKEVLGPSSASKILSYDEGSRAVLLCPVEADKVVEVGGRDDAVRTRISFTTTNKIDSVLKAPGDVLHSAGDLALRRPFGDLGASNDTTIVRGSMVLNKPEKAGRGAIEIWRGHRQSIVFTESSKVGHALLIDHAVAVVSREMSMLDFLEYSKVNPKDHGKCTNLLRGVPILLSHFKDKDGKTFERRKVVYRVSKDSAKSMQISMDDGRSISVKDYYAERYRIRLKYPDLPLIDTSPNPRRGTFFPMELCTVRGGVVRKNLGPKETDEIMNASCLSPQDRFDNVVAVAGTLTGSKSLRDDLGVECSPEPLKVKAEVLAPADVRFSNKSRSSLVRDSVKWDLRDKEVILPNRMRVHEWVVLYVHHRRGPRDGVVENLGQFIRDFQRKYKMQFASDRPAFVKVIPDNHNTRILQGELDKLLKSSAKIRLVFLVVPDEDSTRYLALKHVCDCMKMPSQCIQEKNVLGRGGRPSPQLVANVMLKVNMKLQGMNWDAAFTGGAKLAVDFRTTMVCGMDVHHTGEHGAGAGADATGHVPMTSVVALVASDAEGSYYATVRAVPQRQEVMSMDEMMEMFLERLAKWKETSKGRLPSKILFLRDGVGVAQFQQLVAVELLGIRRALAKAGMPDPPKMCYIVCTKRHHARFFRDVGGTSRSGGPRVDNCDAGTLVDNTVTYSKDFCRFLLPEHDMRDFYLLSHRPLKGTSCPSHYHVILHEFATRPKELERLLYLMCFQFQRSTGAVSMPAPLMHAHLAAFRARYAMKRPDAETRAKLSGLFAATPHWWY